MPAAYQEISLISGSFILAVIVVCEPTHVNSDPEEKFASKGDGDNVRVIQSEPVDYGDTSNTVASIRIQYSIFDSKVNAY